MRADTLFARLAAPAVPEAVALLAPGREPLTHGALAAQIARTVARLNELGIGRGDRVALALPNGPEAALAILGVAAGAVAAPLNPGSLAAEFDQSLADLRPRAIVVPAGSPSPAIVPARRLGIAVLELEALAGPAGGPFELRGPAQPLLAPAGPAGPDDTALLLRTSGTTSRPKLVPILQRKQLVSARLLAESMGLGPADRCLHIVPIYHSQALSTALFAPLLAGGSVVCAPAFLAPRFLEWLAEFSPTWYTAAPAIHQAILAAALHSGAPSHNLRFIRSVSATLPEAVADALEQCFGVPVLNTYAMTEAVPIAAQGLPPAMRKPRSVGRPVGLEVAITAPGSSKTLPAGTTGEILLRGPHVFGGYAGLSAAESGIVDGWFHTGDLGFLDPDGHLFIKGRLKELIIRGGENIAPGEVEEALLAHPGVAEAVAFAMPDARLGEEVAAAIVARTSGAHSGQPPTESELRRFVSLRLASSKVPRRVLVVDRIPTGPTGKPQRLTLADNLGLRPAADRLPAAAEFAPPESEIEELLCELWQAVLVREGVGRCDRFLDLGGDSVLAAQLLVRVSEAFALPWLTLFEFFEAATIAEQASLIERSLLDPSPFGPDVNGQ